MSASNIYLRGSPKNATNFGRLVDTDKHLGYSLFMPYGALIEKAEGLKGKGRENEGFRFNAYFWQEEAGETILDLYTTGFRVYGGVIVLPSYTTRGGSFPNVYLPRPWAEALVEAVLEDPQLRERFPEVFPLVAKSALVEGLMFPTSKAKMTFPQLAADRGLLGT